MRCVGVTGMGFCKGEASCRAMRIDRAQSEEAVVAGDLCLGINPFRAVCL
jgi:hypothetical protein